MNVRETINRHRGLVLAIMGVCVAMSWLLFHPQLHLPQPHLGGLPEKNFYTDDDGTTFFVDDFLKVTPFDHNGKAAYQAVVYHCRNNKPAVSYLARFSAAQRAQLAAIPADDRVDFTKAFMSFQDAMDVKKPGNGNWISAGAKEYIIAKVVTCPDGSGEGLTIVSPSDPDNGAQR